MIGGKPDGGLLHAGGFGLAAAILFQTLGQGHVVASNKKENMKKNLLLIGACALYLTSTPCLAGDVTFDDVDGYQVSLRWGQERKMIDTRKFEETLWVRGKVRGGEKCTQLNIKINLSNTSTGSNSMLTGAMYNYSPDGFANDFYSGKKVFVDRDERNYWVIDSIYARCLN